ncbi:hypothetical protein V1478_018090 [Vespula squamosa]|uniref:Uncharacterized protein n=1 Tax=Vespula squamosa TaxID=30214 RepID=A0ABD1ZWP5_VESSQ
MEFIFVRYFLRTNRNHIHIFHNKYLKGFEALSSWLTKRGRKKTGVTRVAQYLTHVKRLREFGVLVVRFTRGIRNGHRLVWTNVVDLWHNRRLPSPWVVMSALVTEEGSFYCRMANEVFGGDIYLAYDVI